MPIILNETTLDLWLDYSIDFDIVHAEIESISTTDLVEFYKVSTFVNSVKNDGTDCSLELSEFTKTKGIG